MPRDVPADLRARVEADMPGADDGSATALRGYGQLAGLRIAPRSSSGSMASTNRHRSRTGTIAHQVPVRLPYHATASGKSRLICVSSQSSSDGGTRHTCSPVITQHAL